MKLKLLTASFIEDVFTNIYHVNSTMHRVLRRSVVLLAILLSAIRL